MQDEFRPFSRPRAAHSRPMAQGLRAVLTEAAFVVSNIASGAEVPRRSPSAKVSKLDQCCWESGRQPTSQSLPT